MGAEASWASPSEHRERLVGARHEGGVQRLGVPVDLAATRELIELAGPVQAWTGGADRRARLVLHLTAGRRSAAQERMSLRRNHTIAAAPNTTR